MVSRSIRSAQTQIEQQNFEIRKNVLKYDEVLNKQRTVIYDERRRVLGGEDLHEQIRNMIDDVVTAYVAGATSDGFAEDWDLEALWTGLKQLYPVSVKLDELEQRSGGGLSSEFLIEELCADAQAAYDQREELLGVGPDGAPLLRELERRVLLEVLDRKWREHLYEMDYLQEGIQLRGYGQRDPLIEYQREAYDMFNAMMEGIKEEAVGFLFYVQVDVEQLEAPDEAEPETAAVVLEGGEAAPSVFADDAGHGDASAAPPAAADGDRAKVEDVIGRALGLPSHQPAKNLQYTAPTVDGEGGVQHSNAPSTAGGGGGFANASRNAPCPCGSGRKYKRCHGAPGASAPSS
jgi:preprotein translocase subunit SecA